MPSPPVSTFDLATPRRPARADFNDVTKEDDPGDVPDERTMPNALEWNFIDWLLLSLGRVTSVAVISVTGGGSPSVNHVMSIRNTVVNADITPTRNGAGDVSLTWDPDTFPSNAALPEASLNGTGAAGKGMINCEAIANGVRVYTWDSSGAAADRSFTVRVN